MNYLLPLLLVLPLLPLLLLLLLLLLLQGRCRPHSKVEPRQGTV